MEDLAMASFPAHVGMPHYSLSATIQRCIGALLEESPRPFGQTLSNSPFFSVNLTDLFLEEEAPDWIAGLPTLLQTGYELIQLFLLEIHTPTGSGFEVYILKITDT